MTAVRATGRPGTPIRPRSSLGQRLALLLLPLLLAPTLAIGAAGFLRSRALLKEQAASQLTSSAQTKLRPLLERTGELEFQLGLMSQNQDVRRSITALLTSAEGTSEYSAAVGASLVHLRELEANETQRQFTRVLLARASDGRVLVSSDRQWEGSSLTALAEMLLPTDDTATRPVFDDALMGPNQLTLISSAPVRSLEGGPSEAFLLGVNTDLQVGAMMREMVSVWELRGFSIVERGSTFLALEPDVVLHMATASMLPTAVRGVDHPVFRSMAQAPSGTLEYPNLEGVPMLAAYEWLPDWGMGVVVELPQGEVLAGLDQLAPFMAAVIIAASLLTILAVAFTSNRAIRPLTRLVDFAERISHGDWRYRVPEDRDDEVGALASAFNRMAHDLSGMYQSLEDRVSERTQQVRTAAEVARAVISTPALEDLLLRAVDLIRERFGFDHVSIFLLDEKGRHAVLRASTGQVGARLVARGHRLEVGSNSMIGWVSAHNQPRLASDVGQDPVHMKNELLPDTRAEAAVPLQVTGQVLGVLDVQSREQDAFTAEDLEILQTLADQLSAAILNARLAQRSAQAADRARIVSQITLELSGQPDLNSVLQTTARALHQALGSPEVVIAVAQPGGETSPFFAPISDESGASARMPRRP